MSDKHEITKEHPSITKEDIKDFLGHQRSRTDLQTSSESEKIKTKINNGL